MTTAKTTRAEQARYVSKLQDALGENYEVRFDCCESCLTYFYYKGHCYKTVPNEEIHAGINVVDFKAPQELVFACMWQ